MCWVVWWWWWGAVTGGGEGVGGLGESCNRRILADLLDILLYDAYVALG